jgi:hypothetical protein
MYIYTLVGWLTQTDVDQLIQEISGTTVRYVHRIKFGERDSVDIDVIEKLWNVHGGVLFEYVYKELWYSHYLMLPNKLRDDKLKYKLIKDFDYGTTEPQLWCYMTVFIRRMKQRVDTRKRIDELTSLAKEKLKEQLSCYYDCLLPMLIEECDSIPKGEDLFWFKQKERGLLEKKIEETRLKIEEFYRPENEGCKEAEKHFYSVSNSL